MNHYRVPSGAILLLVLILAACSPQPGSPAAPASADVVSSTQVSPFQ